MLRLEIDVYVVVAVRLYRDGIADALRRDPRFALLGSAGSLAEVDAPEPPRVTLVDLALPDGAYAVRSLRRRWPAATVVALAVADADEDVVAWAEAGAAALVSREATLAELLDTVEAAAEGRAAASPAVTAALLRRVAEAAAGVRARTGPPLTRREREIVFLLGRGLSNKEIAGSLRIELPTVKNHVHNILEKLDVERRGDAVAAARARGELGAD